MSVIKPQTPGNDSFHMSILQVPHARPRVILFDWHATLVDTLDAMYHAVDDVLPHLEELGLLDRLLKPSQSKTVEDAKLVSYVRRYRRLHPKIKAARKISRTDIFELLFGPDEDAKRLHRHERRDTSGNHLPISQNHGNVQRHANADEEQRQ